jgi:hypothetical protein
MEIYLMDIIQMELDREKEFTYKKTEINILAIMKIMYKKVLVKNISTMEDIMKENLKIMKL